MKISIVTPSIRPNLLKTLESCLTHQTLQDFEWLVVSPKNFKYGKWIKDPKKNKGDFYALNKAWNAGIKKAQGELFVSIVDGMWFPPETLERLWGHYQRDKMSCVSLVGDQYDEMQEGRPEHRVWTDPRKRNGIFYQIPPVDLELCLASLPMKGIKYLGGFDEEFDKFPAWSEKDLAVRMAAIGFRCYIDQSIEYRAIHHPRLAGSLWDQKYPESTQYFNKCLNEVMGGSRLRLAYLK